MGKTINLTLPSDESWTLLKVQRQGFPDMLMINDVLQNFQARELFPFHLSIVIAVSAVDGEGLPTEDEQQIVNAIGAELENTLGSCLTEFGAPNVLYFARSTWNGKRELIFRVHKPDIASHVLEAKLASKKWPRAWNFGFEEDPAWRLTTSIATIYAAASPSTRQ